MHLDLSSSTDGLLDVQTLSDMHLDLSSFTDGLLDVKTLSDMTIKRGKGFPYLLPSIEHGADPGVQAVSPQVTISHPPGGRLPLLSARPAVTFSAAEHHNPWAGTQVTVPRRVEG